MSHDWFGNLGGVVGGDPLASPLATLFLSLHCAREKRIITRHGDDGAVMCSYVKEVVTKGLHHQSSNNTKIAEENVPIML